MFERFCFGRGKVAGGCGLHCLSSALETRSLFSGTTIVLPFLRSLMRCSRLFFWELPSGLSSAVQLHKLSPILLLVCFAWAFAVRVPPQGRAHREAPR